MPFILDAIRKNCFEISFRILFFVFGVLYLFILPPQCVPDETTHFATAYYYADILMEGGAHDEIVLDSVGIVRRRITMRQQDAETIERLRSVVLDTDKLYPAVKEKSAGSVDETVRQVVDTAPYLFAAYMPSTAAIILCRLLGVGSMTMIYISRLATFLVSYLIVCRAARCMPTLKALPMVVALLPMSLHLFASSSPDSMLIALSLYAVARILQLRGREEIRFRDCVTLGIALAVVAATKPMYFVMLFLVLLLLGKKMNGKKQAAAVYAYLTLFPIAVWLMVYLSHMLIPSADFQGVYNIYRGEEAQLYSLSYVIKNPAQTLELLLHSIVAQLRTRIAWSVGSALGYLNIFLPRFVYFGSLAALLCSMIPVGDETVRLGKKNRFMLGGMFVLSVLICYIGMLFWETTVESTEIFGVQGRYFIPLMLPLGLAAAPRRAPLAVFRKLQSNWIALGMMVVINIFTLVNVYGQLSA